jgi:threonine/homoserine/homoserine lactone efflux protein
METIIRNILLGIALAAPIGPAGIAVIKNGLNNGFTKAFLTGIGITLADTTYLLVVFFGLSGFIEKPVVKAVLWMLGAIVLTYLGFQSIKSAFSGIDFGGAEASTGKNPLLSGYLVNISNPVAVVFWVGIFGAMLENGENKSKAAVLLLSSTILIGILIWHATASVLSALGKRYLNEGVAKCISAAAGTGLILFGVKFAFHVAALLRQ